MAHDDGRSDDGGYEDHGFSGREPSRGGYDDHGYGRGDYRDRAYLSRGFFRDRGAPNQGPHGRHGGDDDPDALEGGPPPRPDARDGQLWYRGGDAHEEGYARSRRVRLEHHAPAAGGARFPVSGRDDSHAGGRGFAGIGPKGWRRSDERIRDEICEALTRHPAIDPSDVEVEVTDGVVRLVGIVGDRAAKWLAEDLAERSFGVRDVMNEIRVRRAD